MKTVERYEAANGAIMTSYIAKILPEIADEVFKDRFLSWKILGAIVAVILLVAAVARADEPHKYVDDMDMPHPHTTIPSRTFLPCGWTAMGHGVERLVDCDARVVCFLKREHGAACFKL